MKFFALGEPKNCTDHDVCDAWAKLTISAGDQALKALDIERTHLNAEDYDNAYSTIIGTYTDAMELQIKLNNPDIELPDVTLTAQQAKKLDKLTLEQIKEYNEHKGQLTPPEPLKRLPRP